MWRATKHKLLDFVVDVVIVLDSHLLSCVVVHSGKCENE
jgi:hypothetical protein